MLRASISTEQACVHGDPASVPGNVGEIPDVRSSSVAGFSLSSSPFPANQYFAILLLSLPNDVCDNSGLQFRQGTWLVSQEKYQTTQKYNSTSD